MLPKPEVPLNLDTSKYKLKLPTHVGVHSKLALLILRLGGANQQRAFAIWAVLRSNIRPFYSKVELVTILKKTGKSGRTIERWLKDGEGIFWYKEYCKKTNQIRYFWISGHKVFNYFKLGKPGTVLTISVSELLNPKLTILRAALKDCFIHTETKWASRQTIAHLTGVPRRTQQLYDKESGLHRQYCCELKNWVDNKGKRHDVVQIPTLYHARFERYHIHNKNKHKYGLYVPEYNAMEKPDSQSLVGIEVNRNNGRYFYADEQGAYDKVDSMEYKGVVGQVVYRNNISKRGNIVVKGLHTPY